MIPIPWFQLLSGLAAALGLGGLFWYSQLTPAQKKLADQKARELAIQMFNKEVEHLTHEQGRQLNDRLKTYFTGS